MWTEAIFEAAYHSRGYLSADWSDPTKKRSNSAGEKKEDLEKAKAFHHTCKGIRTFARIDWSTVLFIASL